MQEYCSTLRKSLLLDIHGALDPEEREKLETHLNICRSCRIERKQLSGLLGKMRQVEEQELSAAELDTMINQVRMRIRTESKRKSWLKVLFASPARFLPIAAAASVLIFISIYGYQAYRTRSGLRLLPQQHQTLTQQDLEVIKNLELLKNMDTIQKLVHAVDGTSTDSPEKGDTPGTHGLI